MKEEYRKNVERVMVMEAILHKMNAETKAMSVAVAHYASLQEEYKKLIAYYYSDEITADNEVYRAGQFSENEDAYVLSEDGIYDLISEHFNLAKQMLRLASSMISDE